MRRKRDIQPNPSSPAHGRGKDNTSLRLMEFDDFELDATLPGRIREVCLRLS